MLDSLQSRFLKLSKKSLAILWLFFFASSAKAQEFALEQLNASPRHHEWIQIPSDRRIIHSFVAYPQKSQNSPAVIVLHENRGLTDWVRSFADQLAEAGYLAIAPDLLSDFNSEYHRTSDFKNPDDAREALYKLDPDQITSDLLAVQRYISQEPSSSGKTAVIGFCWGGAQAFRFATNASNLSTVLVFYGSPPEDKQIRKISAPVYGFYGENDQRINSTIPKTKKLMKKYRKTYNYEIYPGAGHAFMRDGDDPKGSPDNKRARDDSWIRIKKILSQIQ